MGFPRKEYWSELRCLPPGDLLDPEIEPKSLISPTVAGGLFTTSTSWEAPKLGDKDISLMIHFKRMTTRSLRKSQVLGFKAEKKLFKLFSYIFK